MSGHLTRGFSGSTRVGDRRSQLRFQVVGTMPASLLSSEPLRVINLGTCGALVEGPVSLPPNAEYRMQLVLAGQISEVTAKVRRVSVCGRDASALRYEIGLEFLFVSPETEELISRVVAAAEAQV